LREAAYRIVGGFLYVKEVSALEITQIFMTAFSVVFGSITGFVAGVAAFSVCVSIIGAAVMLLSKICKRTKLKRKLQDTEE